MPELEEMPELQEMFEPEEMPELEESSMHERSNTELDNFELSNVNCDEVMDHSVACCSVMASPEIDLEESCNPIDEDIPKSKVPKMPTAWDNESGSEEDTDVDEQFPVRSAGRQTFGSTRHLRNWTINDSQELDEYAR